MSINIIRYFHMRIPFVLLVAFRYDLLIILMFIEHFGQLLSHNLVVDKLVRDLSKHFKCQFTHS